MVEHLRNAFAVLINPPSLLDPKKIDSFLLTGTFSRLTKAGFIKTAAARGTLCIPMKAICYPVAC